MSIIKQDFGEIGGGGTSIDYDTTGKTATSISMSTGVDYTVQNDGIWVIQFIHVGYANIYINGIQVALSVIYDNNTYWQSSFIVKAGDILKYTTANATGCSLNQLYS